jgi:hypothetical protein
MGYSADIMYDFAMKDLRMVFPEYEGWKGQEASSDDLNEKIFSFSRRSQGIQENGMAMVVFDQAISQPEIDSFIAMCAKIPHCTKRLLLVPRLSIVGASPGTVQVKEMSAFGYEDGNLVWLTKKKNAGVPSDTATATSG